MVNWYASRAALRARQGYTSAQTADDAILDAVLEVASRAVEQIARRRFSVETRTRYYTPEWGDLLLVDDLLSLTSLATDDAADRTYATTWSATDYDLEPVNAPYESPPRPYTKLCTAPKGTRSFPAGVARGAKLVGSWGCYDVRNSAVTTLNGAINSTTATSVVVASGAALEVGQTILVDSEQLFISAISTNTLTVTRGVNGTTAATHSGGANVDVYTYPLAGEATLLLASRFKSRKDSPAGVLGSVDIGQMILLGKRDPDVMALLQPLMRLGVVAAG